MPSVDAGGTELHYARSGSGEPLLLIQGMSATHLAWGQPFLSALEESFECIVFDNRGMGLSGPAAMPFTVGDLAADTAALLDALEIERAHVLGISLGGMVAQELALAHPDRIRTLALGATYCGGPGARHAQPEVFRRLGAAMASGNRDQAYRAWWKTVFSPTFRADESRFADYRSMAEALPAPRPVIIEQLRAGAAHDTSNRLSDVSASTLVIHGTADVLMPTVNGRQIAALTGARLELLDGVGHLFWWEQPGRSASLIGEHASTSE